jgi:hypothetical protein
MKVTYEFNTADDSFDVCEYEQIKHANDMAAALWGLSNSIRCWCREGDAITPETISDVFFDILAEHHLDLDILYQ